MLQSFLAPFLLCVVASVVAAAQATAPRPPAPGRLDLAILNGRVIDPESGLDAVRNLGIRGDRIVEIGTEPLNADDAIDASGLVVSPGFVDIHRHAHGDNSYRFAALDGVTSAFELEVGTPDVDAWYRMMGPARLINFGVGAGHIGARMQVLGDRGFMLPTGPGRGPASPAQAAEILKAVEAGLDAGGLAVGMGLAYTPAG